MRKSVTHEGRSGGGLTYTRCNEALKVLTIQCARTTALRAGGHVAGRCAQCQVASGYSSFSKPTADFMRSIVAVSW